MDNPDVNICGFMRYKTANLLNLFPHEDGWWVHNVGKFWATHPYTNTHHISSHLDYLFHLWSKSKALEGMNIILTETIPTFWILTKSKNILVILLTLKMLFQQYPLHIRPTQSIMYKEMQLTLKPPTPCSLHWKINNHWAQMELALTSQFKKKKSIYC